MTHAAPVLLFDFDGTIADSELGILRSWRHTFTTLGMPVLSDDETRQMIGPPLTAVAETLSEDVDVQAALVATYLERYDRVGVTEACLFPGVAEVLAELRSSGYRLVIATSKTERIAARMTEMFGLNELFEVIAGSIREGGRRHKHEVIEYALNQLDETDRTRMLMIGDREHDVFGAARLGIDCVGVLWGYGTKQELTRAGASYLAGTPTQLLDHVRTTLPWVPPS